MTDKIVQLVPKRFEAITLGETRFRILYIEEDEDDPDLDNLVDQILDKGVELEHGLVVPIVSRSIFGSIKRAYDENGEEGFEFARILKSPCLQASLDLVGARANVFNSDTLISLSPRITNEFLSSFYRSPEVLPRIYSELRMIRGQKYDGFLEEPELEPFIGCYFGSIQHLPYILDCYSDQRLFASGMRLPVVNGAMIQAQFPFDFLIPSIEHKEFSFVESNPEIFQQRMVAKLSYVALRDDTD